MKLILMTILFFLPNLSYGDIKILKYMAANLSKRSDSFIIRFLPNPDLSLVGVKAIYKKRDNTRVSWDSTSLENGADIVIKKNIKNLDGLPLSELVFHVDQSHFNGLSQITVGGFSMWAGDLQTKLLMKEALPQQVVKYTLANIGWHGTHLLFKCAEEGEQHVQKIDVLLNGITTVNLLPYKHCKQHKI